MQGVRQQGDRTHCLKQQNSDHFITAAWVVVIPASPGASVFQQGELQSHPIALQSGEEQAGKEEGLRSERSVTRCLEGIHYSTALRAEVANIQTEGGR